jgi:Zn-dependent protease
VTRTREIAVEDSIRLGRVAGVPIGLNWSWVVVFGLLVWSLAQSVFPSANPGLSTATYAVMSIVAALAFFASLLLHELGHAVVARREGVELDGITLWLFGGVARIRGLLPSPRAELQMALAGPAVTAAIVLLCVGLAHFTRLPPAVDGVSAWLGYINLVLLGFNLLPALPLDGGRVLRSALWKARADFGWATVVAAAIGRVIGIALIAAGFASIGFIGLFGGVWLALIGWFLFHSAGAEATPVSAPRGARRPDVRSGAAEGASEHHQSASPGRVLGLFGVPLEAPDGDQQAGGPPTGEDDEIVGGKAAALRVRAEAGREGFHEVAEREEVRKPQDPVRRSVQGEDAGQEVHREERQVRDCRCRLQPTDERRNGDAEGRERAGAENAGDDRGRQHAGVEVDAEDRHGDDEHEHDCGEAREDRGHQPGSQINPGA